MDRISFTEYKTQTKALLLLGGPLIVNNLAVAGMAFADAVMAGSIGARELAAVAVGGSFWFLGFTLVLGVLMAISPIVSRHFGAGNYDLIGRYTRQGIYLGVIMGIPLLLLGQFAAAPLLERFGIDPEFRDLTVGYVGGITLGAPAIFVFLALRFTTEGIGYLRPIMITSIFALVCNIFLNYVLMFGHFGAPALGAVGCGYASAITMWIIMFTLAGFVLKSEHYRPFHIFSRIAPPRLDVFKEIIFLGVPIAITITAESGLFSAVSILMGTRGTDITAAHQIAINFSSTMFMIPLALSGATTVLVGQLIGAGKFREAKVSGWVGILLCAGFMTVSATFLLIFRDAVVGIYTDDSAVIGIAISLLLMAAIFQIADGIQIGAAGALRGYKDTAVPMVINIVAFWVLAFPLAYLAAITYQAPPNYIWATFVLALSVAAILLTWRYRRLSARAVRQMV
jgi:MATE family multidrug resistance protein